jgi:hypothetical protein
MTRYRYVLCADVDDVGAADRLALELLGLPEVLAVSGDQPYVVGESVTLTLSAREARAIINAANLLCDALEAQVPREDIKRTQRETGLLVPPLRSAAMRVETTLMAEQIDL